MSGETSKAIGELGEKLAQILTGKFGWTQLGTSGVDFPCEDSSHKTKNDGDKRTHGIDAVFAYEDPYSKAQKVVIVEAKAISWRKGKGEQATRKTASAIRKQLNDYANTLIEKVSCAKRSAKFREQYGLVKTAHSIEGLLVYFVTEHYDSAGYKEALNNLVIPASDGAHVIRIVSNEQMDSISTAFNALTTIAAEERLSGVPEFYYPDFEIRKSQTPWHGSITLELLTSAFFVVSLRERGISKRTFIFFFGTCSIPGIRRLLAALGRYQVQSMDLLLFVPISNINAIEARPALEMFFKNNKLIFEDKEVEIDIRSVPRIQVNLADGI